MTGLALDFMASEICVVAALEKLVPDTSPTERNRTRSRALELLPDDLADRVRSEGMTVAAAVAEARTRQH